MNVRGERFLIVGDSLSHPGADAAPTIQEVTLGSNRISSAPGDLLASMLLEAGAEAARIDAKVGRSAISFFANEPGGSLLQSDAAWRPSKVVIMLGTNDAERGLDKTIAAMTQLRDAYRQMGAEVIAIGPMQYVGRGSYLNAPAAALFEQMQQVFGIDRTIDARPLSAQVDPSLRTSDGIHFQAPGARQLAPLLMQELLRVDTAIARIQRRPLVSVAIGFGVVFALGMLVWAVKRRNTLGRSPQLKASDEDDDEDDAPDWGEDSWFTRINARRQARVDEVKRALATSPAVIVNDGRHDRLMIVSGEMQNRDEGAYRVTTFDDDGPVGHSTQKTMDKIAEEISHSGFKTIRAASDADVMAWTSTPKFVEGSKRVAFVQAVNALHFRAKDRDAAHEVEQRAHKLAAEGKWDDAVLTLQRGIKELGRPRAS